MRPGTVRADRRRRLRRWLPTLALFVASMASTACALLTGDDRVEDVMVAMDDGVRLATTVYYPEGTGPWSVVLMRTPYGRDREQGWRRTLSEHGIVLVVQDTRGRFDSEGEDVAFLSDRRDGHATLRWIAARAWSNGRVMTFGASALGITQYMLAPDAPDVLRCQWIEVATPDLYDGAIYQGGVYREALASGWLAGNDSEHMIAPFKAHDQDGAYWDPVRIEDYGAVRVPAFHVSGWYDIFARGTIEGFRGYQHRGGEGARGRQHLIMGGWTHAINDPQVGELTVPNAELDLWPYQETLIRACLLDDAEARAALDALPAVTYFTLGDVDDPDAPGNVWRTATTWPPPGSEPTPLYLRTGGALSREAPASQEPGVAFTYDPADPSPTVGGANLNRESGSYDQREIEARDDVVVYTSPALDTPIEVTGDLRAEIWIVTDVPDTDVVVRLTDVYPDGRSMLVADSIARAAGDATPLTPGEPVRVVVDLGPHSYVFNRGHRVRVSVTSANAPRFAPNPNTGAAFLAPGETGRLAHTTVLHDAAHPSALVAPLVTAR